MEEDEFQVDLLDFDLSREGKGSQMEAASNESEPTPQDVIGIAKLFSNYSYSIFEMNEPLGEILYQSHDQVDGNVNESPEFVRFVNEMQKLVFSGSSDESAILRQGYNYTFFNESSGDYATKQYRFYGQSFRTEDKAQVNDSRPIDEYNMIVIIIEDVAHSQTVFVEATGRFTSHQIELFKQGSIVLTLSAVLFYITYILGFIKVEVISPISELTNAIMKPKGTDQIQRFVDRIQYRNIRSSDRKFRWQFKRLQRLREIKRRQMERLNLPLTNVHITDQEFSKIVREEVDEVERLRFLFSQLFNETRSFQQEEETRKALRKLKKTNCEYNRGETFFRKPETKKLVMRLEEQGSINTLNLEYIFLA